MKNLVKSRGLALTPKDAERSRRGVPPEMTLRAASWRGISEPKL